MKKEFLKEANSSSIILSTSSFIGEGIDFSHLDAIVLGLFFFVLRCVCVSSERLPFRMPLGLCGKDKGDPLPGRRGYAKPEGLFFLGNALNGKELWLKAKDILTHMLLFGTTGSGKTETLVSLAYNSLATGSGLFYIDPKASPKLAVQIW